MPVSAPPRLVHRARLRSHLVAVPVQTAPLVTTIGRTAVDAVAADAQRELATLGNALHDGPVQSLIAASLALQLAERAALAADAVPFGLAEAREALEDALAGLRTMMSALTPPPDRGGLGGMLAALAERADLDLDDRATGPVSAELSTGVFRLLAALGAADAAGVAPVVTVVTRDRPGVVLCEVRLRGAGAAARSRTDEVLRALRRLDALGARAAVARASGGADLLVALPSDSHSAPSPALGRSAATAALLDTPAGARNGGSVTTLTRTGTEN